MTTELSIQEKENIEDVISRYTAWLFKDVPNPYNNSKWEWIRETQEKIKELELKIKKS